MPARRRRPARKSRHWSRNASPACWKSCAIGRSRNMIPAASGRLEKLRIQAFTTPDYSGAAAQEFAAYVNPSEITLGYEVEYDAAQDSGKNNSRMEFKKNKPGDLTLTFFMDGTGSN